MPWISLISFRYIQVDFVVSEWISWISLFRQWISLIRRWISWQWLDFVDFGSVRGATGSASDQRSEGCGFQAY